MTSIACIILASALAATPTRPAAPACPDVDRLAWLAGTWTGTAGEVEMEEHWTAAKGATMLGLHRDVAGGKTVSFEFLRIEQSAAGVVYQAQPKGRPPVPFTCVETGAARVVFENQAHDFPQRILYWKTDDGRLHARVEGQVGGKLEGEEWTWSRAE